MDMAKENAEFAAKLAEARRTLAWIEEARAAYAACLARRLAGR